MANDKKFILIILDGWGIGDHSVSDAIYQADTPYLDSLVEKYPNSHLLACGEDVGLPNGQMGNSEVGHLNIGAGRVIYQDLVKINKSIKNDSISKNKILQDAYKYAKENDKSMHLIGLVSDGGVHSLDKHLYKLCDIGKDYGLDKLYIHALMDGRDTDPKSGLGFLENLENHLKNSAGQIATVCGRYYTMDRDNRWKRVKRGYDLMVRGIGKHTDDVIEAVQESYDNEVTDEFIKPIVRVNGTGAPIATIKPGDLVFCFNFRSDRLREITTALTQNVIPEFDMKPMDLYYLTMTRYDDNFKNVHIVFDKEHVHKTLGGVIARADKKQLRIAETEKYPHVTFFFSGGWEDPFKGESRILIPSPKVPTYDLQPEMSAYLVKDAVVAELNKREQDFICLNFANGDMVGHTGVYKSILKAVRVVDECVREVVETAKKNNYSALITADHGNADHAVNNNLTPNTAHSLNPVPCILVNENYKSIESGILADVAPTILTIMGMDIPSEMTGKPLVK